MALFILLILFLFYCIIGIFLAYLFGLRWIIDDLEIMIWGFFWPIITPFKLAVTLIDKFFENIDRKRYEKEEKRKE